MGFWGALVTPENHISIIFDDSLGRLHVSKATLEERDETSDDTLCNDTKLYCQLREKQPIALCSLGRSTEKMCDLNLQFTGTQGAVLSVCGPHDIAVSGFYLDNVPTTRLPVDQNGGKQRRKKRKRNLDKLQIPAEGDNTITIAEHEQNPKKKLRKRHKKKTEEQLEAALAEELEERKDVKEGDHPLLSGKKLKEKLRKKRKQKTKELLNRVKDITPSEIKADTAIATGEASPIVEEVSSEDYDMMPQPKIKLEEYKNVGIENRNSLADTNKQDDAAQRDEISNMVVIALPASNVPVPKPKGQRSRALVLRMIDILDPKK